MKVIIFYAKYGGGHLSAARSIENCINTYYKNVNVELIDFMEYANKEFNKITTKAYAEMAKKLPKAYGSIYWKSEKGPLAHISTTSNKLLSIKINKLLQEKSPDLIICTHPFASQMCGYLTKHHKLNTKIATILTDFASHDQWLVYNEYINYLFVSNIEMKETLMSKNIPANKIFVTGIPISERFLNKYDKKSLFIDFNLNPNKKVVLFFGGGEFGLGKNYTLKVFETFVKDSADIQIIAISGKNRKMKEAFENIVIENHKEANVQIFEYTNKVPEFMSISNLVVTKPGGLTTSESLASGLPIVVINPIPGQEEKNAEYLVNHNTAIWLKKDDNVEEIINNLLSDSSKLEEMSNNAKSISKPNSTNDICKILLNN